MRRQRRESAAELRDEGGNLVEGVVEHRADAVADALVRHQPGVGEQPDRLAELVDPRELVAVAGEQQHRAGDVRPVLGALVVGMAGPVQRVAEEDEPGDVVGLLRCQQAGDAPAEGVAADHRRAWRLGKACGVDGERPLGAAHWEVDRGGVDAAGPEPGDVGRHRRRRPGRAVREEDMFGHALILAGWGVAPSRMLRMSAILRLQSADGTVIADHVEAATSLWPRFMGLMLRDTLPEGHGLVLRPCSSIHMFFMRFPIDAVFVEGGGTVLGLRRHLRPWVGFASCRKAKACIELRVGTIDSAGLEVGEKVELVAG